MLRAEADVPSLAPPLRSAAAALAARAMPDSTALEPTVIDEDLCRRCVGKLQPPTERQGEGSSDAKKETAQREIKYLMFSYKNILKIDNLVGFDKLVKLQLDNNIIEKIENLGSQTILDSLNLSQNCVTFRSPHCQTNDV